MKMGVSCLMEDYNLCILVSVSHKYIANNTADFYYLKSNVTTYLVMILQVSGVLVCEAGCILENLATFLDTKG